MKRRPKIILITLSGLTTLLIVLRLAGLNTFNIPSPAMENTIPVGTKILAWNTNFEPKRFEVILYRNPEMDTVLIPYEPLGYYAAKRLMGSKAIDQRFKKAYVPLGNREIWIGRCVGLPGDVVELQNGNLLVNGELYENSNMKKSYSIQFKSDGLLNRKWLESYQLEPLNKYSPDGSHVFHATELQVDNLLNSGLVDSSYCMIQPANKFDNRIFPFNEKIPWNRDNFGAIQIPQKGVELNLSIDNIAMYQRLIESFEENELSIRASKIYINERSTDTYTPKQDYYFICNDNRHNSLDSRFFGFVPQDHIAGKILYQVNWP